LNPLLVASDVVEAADEEGGTVDEAVILGGRENAVAIVLFRAEKVDVASTFV
jgi:hypothetical protein